MSTDRANSDPIDLGTYRSALQDVSLVDCEGYVVRVSGSTIESAGPVLGIGEQCLVHMRDHRNVTAEVVGFKRDHLILLPLEHIERICPGDSITARRTPRHICLGPDALGRVLNGLGEPIDGKGPLVGTETRQLDVSSPAALSRKRISEPLALGIRSNHPKPR